MNEERAGFEAVYGTIKPEDRATDDDQAIYELERIAFQAGAAWQRAQGARVPEKKAESVRWGYRSLGYAEGWNACVDAMLADPAHPAGCKVVPVELLERLEHVTRTLVPHLQCHVELRALLASTEGVKDE